MQFLTTLSTLLLALSTLTLSTPTPNSPSDAAAADVAPRSAIFPGCILGQMICGWSLINNGVDQALLRDFLCQDMGRCDGNSGDIWNTLWQCVADNNVVAQYIPGHVCGGAYSCVIDKFNWAYTCKGGSC
ncbi:hypothetical protein BU26DRAFT_515957 [Trematosphaeria pertusa]|uniref:Uncharacterized protein n=1 Tax=Trematosphaeria pertusa TaxID=390896 RepID=A0A6A6ITY5_9PLEO|nr:uncharacterized protein BU26DRAFT_515957 [Trematosphaeria pertusa]KAF2253638.1 hypothetical protein BU26DRAFT_515957 [Trematosphaeria pertusa]